MLGRESKIYKILQCARVSLICAGVLSPLGAVDYTDYNIPATITLSGGIRNDTITSTPPKSSYQASTIGYGRNPHLTLQGTSGSQYQLTINDNTTTYYSGGFSVAAGIQAGLMNVHTLSLERGSISVASGASFTVYSSGNSISAQGSDYGGDSKVWLQKGSNLTLATNATANFQNARFFISEGTTTVGQNAKLTISATNAVRLQNSLTNNGGTITLEGPTQNIGSYISVTKNGVSTITNNSGEIIVKGDFYNGGQGIVEQSSALLSPDPAFAGGGNLVINGGTMTINGKLTSTQGGDPVYGGGINNPQNSSISVNGGTLTVTGGLENGTGSTISFGASGGVMGQIKGDVNNTSGNAIIVNIAGASAGKTYTLITGNLTGTNTNFSIQGTEFISATQNGNGITLTTNQSVIDSFESSLNANQKAILNAFNTDGNIYTYGSGETLRSDINAVSEILDENLTHTAPLGVSTLLANANLSMQTAYRDSISIAPLASFSSHANGLKGGVYGLNLNASKRAGKHLFSVYAGYGYGNGAYQNSAGKLESSSHQMLLALQDRISLGKLEADIMGYYGYGSSDVRRNLSVFSQNHSANGKLSFQEFGLRLNVAMPLRALPNFTFSPYIGLGYAFSNQGAMNEANADSLRLSAGARNVNRIEGAVGLRTIYTIKDYALFVGGEMSYGFITPNAVNASVGSNAGAGSSAGAGASANAQNLSYKHSAGLGYYLYIGGAMPIYKRLSIGLSGSYGTSALGFSTAMGSVNLSWDFSSQDVATILQNLY